MPIWFEIDSHFLHDFLSLFQLRRSLYLGDTVYEVVAESTYEEESQAFTGLVQAMYDTNTVAIVRRCFSERSSPEIGFLRPHISHDHIVSAKRKGVLHIFFIRSDLISVCTMSNCHLRKIYENSNLKTWIS